MNKSRVKSARSLTSEQQGWHSLGSWRWCLLVAVEEVGLSMALSTFQHSGLWDGKQWLTGMFPANLRVCKII